MRESTNVFRSGTRDLSGRSMVLCRLLFNQGLCQAVAALLANTPQTYSVPRFITPNKQKRRHCLRVLLLDQQAAQSK